MKEFTTRITTVRDIEVSGTELRQIADNIELSVNDYIEQHWDVDEATDVPLEIRQRLLLHVIREMFNPNSDFNWMD